jgi:uncharacterized protein YndB with AHSA1/START domain
MNNEAATIVRVSRRFDATPERVFDAWLNPATAGRWLFATPAGEMRRVEIDARVGGRYAVVERREQGDAGHFGEYLEIDRPRRLVFTLAMEPDAPSGDRITVEIRPLGTGCELTLTHVMAAEYADYAQRTESGWGDVLASLSRQFAAAAARIDAVGRTA